MKSFLDKIKIKAELIKLAREGRIEAAYRIETMQKKYDTTKVSEMEKPLIEAKTIEKRLIEELKNGIKAHFFGNNALAEMTTKRDSIIGMIDEMKKREDEIVETHNHISKTVRDCARMCRLIDQKLPKLGELIANYEQFRRFENEYQKYVNEHNEIPKGEEIDPFDELVRIYNLRTKIEKTFEGVSTMLYEAFDAAANLEKIGKLKEILTEAKEMDKKEEAERDKRYITGDTISLFRRNTGSYVELLEKEIAEKV